MKVLGNMLVRSLAPLTCSLARHYLLCSRAPLHSLARSLTSLTPSLVGQLVIRWRFILCFLPILDHSAMAVFLLWLCAFFFYAPSGVAQWVETVSNEHWTRSYHGQILFTMSLGVSDWVNKHTNQRAREASCVVQTNEATSNEVAQYLPSGYLVALDHSASEGDFPDGIDSEDVSP